MTKPARCWRSRRIGARWPTAKIAEHQSRIVKLTGDGMLVEFPTVVNAVACAADIQRRMHERNVEVPEERRIGGQSSRRKHPLRCD